MAQQLHCAAALRVLKRDAPPCATPATVPAANAYTHAAVAGITTTVSIGQLGWC
jgi:hypothetical protein